jgi:hypothetical protein
MKKFLCAVVFLALATGCGLCERASEKPASSRSAAELASLIPADASVAVFAGDWRDVRDVVAVLRTRLGKDLPIDAGIAEIKRKYGVDLMSLDQLGQRGVETSRGLAVTQVDKVRVFLLPVDAPKLFEQYVTVLAKERWDAAETSVSRTVGDKSITLFVRAGTDTQKSIGKDDVVMALGFRDRTAILIPGAGLGAVRGDPEVVLGKLLTLKEGESLKASAGFDDLRGRLGGEFPFFVHYDLASDIEERAEALEAFMHSKARAAALRQRARDAGPVGFGVRLDDDGVKIHAEILVRGELKKTVSLASTALGPIGALRGGLSDEAVLVARLSGDPMSAPQELMGMMGEDAEDSYDELLGGVERMFGLKVRDEVLPSLDGNLALAVYDASIALLINPNFESLMRTTRSVVVVGVQDRAKLLGALDKAAEESGGLLIRGTDGDVVTYALDGSGGGLAVGLTAAAVGSRKMSMDALTRAARLGHKGAKEAGATEKLWLGEGKSGLTIAVPRVLEMLGPMAKQGSGKILLQFSTLTLVFQSSEAGAAFDLELPFVAAKPKTDGP